MRKSVNGFTIVELLIVIVVIAILAAISVVAFNGIQARAQNTQTLSALESWTKALHLHKTDRGAMPGGWVCLGEKNSYPYGLSGNDATGAQCRHEGSSNFVVNDSFNEQMAPYLGGAFPNPSMVTTARPDGSWRRGLMYAYNGGAGNLTYISASFKGDIACPVIGGVVRVEKTNWQGDTVCVNVIEER